MASVSATVPAAEAGAPTCPSLSAKLVSLFPPVGARICSAAGLAPFGLPSPARHASPGEPAGRHPDGATLPAAPEPPRLLPATRGQSSVMSGNRLKQKDQSSLGPSVQLWDKSSRARGVCGDLVIVLFKFKVDANGRLACRVSCKLCVCVSVVYA